MKPHVILHMMSSIDGRIVVTDWPKTIDLARVYEEAHARLGGDAWIVGRATMEEFAEGDPRPMRAIEAYPRETWKAPGSGKGPYGIAFDRHGKLHLNRGDANSDPLVMVLSEAVSDDHLAELRRDGISYVFAGASDIDLGTALSVLVNEFGIKRLLLEGGGGINGAFLAENLIDEISLLILPIADGAVNAPTVFDRTGGTPLPLALSSVTQLDDGVVHLRYKVD